MKESIASVRRKVLTCLNREVTKIHLIRIGEKERHCAHSEYDLDTPVGKGEIEMWIDVYNSSLVLAVIHEILHRILDKHLDTWATYDLYETFLLSLEKEIYKPLTRKQKRRWRNVINSKVVGRKNI